MEQLLIFAARCCVLGFLGRSRRRRRRLILIARYARFVDRVLSRSPETIVLNREDRRSNCVRKLSTSARGIFFDPRAIPLESVSFVGNLHLILRIASAAQMEVESSKTSKKLEEMVSTVRFVYVRAASQNVRITFNRDGTCVLAV